MQTQKTIGWLFIIAAISLFIPYTLLSMLFEYPMVLRQDTATILAKFYQGGNQLIWVWFAFAITGMPLIPAYLMLGKQLESKSLWMGVATTVGVVGLMVQMIGLLRWVFVVPALAKGFALATDEPTKAATIVAFTTMHQFGGVLLGEHLGQLFTIIWTVIIIITFTKHKLMPAWVNWLGLGSSFIYLLAQADLFATVMPGFPVWEPAGFIGSTLWLLWLIIIGIQLCKKPIL